MVLMHENKECQDKRDPASLCLNPCSKLKHVPDITDPFPSLGHIRTRMKTSNDNTDQDKVTTILRNTQPQTAFLDLDNFNIDLHPRETSAIT